MTGDFSKISNGTQAFFKKKPQQDVPKNVADLAKEMMIFADKNDSAISQSQFQIRLAQMESLNTKDLIKFIRSFDKDESIIELICDEIGSTDKIFDEKSKKEINIRQYACKKVLNALVNKAKELGIDTFDFENQKAINNTSTQTNNTQQISQIAENNIYNPDNDMMGYIMWQNAMDNNNIKHFDNFDIFE